MFVILLKLIYIKDDLFIISVSRYTGKFMLLSFWKASLNTFCHKILSWKIWWNHMDIVLSILFFFFFYVLTISWWYVILYIISVEVHSRPPTPCELDTHWLFLNTVYFSKWKAGSGKTSPRICQDLPGFSKCNFT